MYGPADPVPGTEKVGEVVIEILMMLVMESDTQHGGGCTRQSIGKKLKP